MHSSLLMKGFHSLKDNVPRMMLEAASQDRPLEYVFDELVIPRLPNGSAFQPWYEEVIQNIASLDRTAGAISGLDEKLRELGTVSVIEAGNPIADLIPVKIDESKQSIEALRGDKALLYKRQEEYLRLRNEAPVLVRPALEKYAKSMGYLASDNVTSGDTRTSSAPTHATRTAPG